MAKESPSVEECLAMGMTCAFHNLRRASRAVTQVYDAYFEEIGLKATQFTVLAALLYESEGWPPTVTDLAETLVLEQSSLSRNLAVLERLGYITLVPGDDRRERIVTLTRPGRLALSRGYPVWKQAQTAVTEALESKELDTQIRSLRRLTKTALSLRHPHGERTVRPRREA